MQTWQLLCLLAVSACHAAAGLSGGVYYSVQPAEFVWQAPSENGQPLHLSDESHKHIDSLPFPFPFFGEAHSDLFVSSNGALVFHPTTGVSQHSYQAVDRFPSTDAGALKDLVAGLWDDLKPSAATDSQAKGDVYYEAFSDRVVITYDRMEYWLSRKQPNTFQIILEKDGSIVVQYLTGSRNPSTRIGLQNEDGTVGTNFDEEIAPNSAIRFVPMDNCGSAPATEQCLSEHREPCSALSPSNSCGRCLSPFSEQSESGKCALHCDPEQVSEELCSSLGRENCDVSSTPRNSCGACLEGLWVEEGDAGACRPYCSDELDCAGVNRQPCDQQKTLPDTCGACLDGYYEKIDEDGSVCVREEEYCANAPSKLHCFDLNRRACSVSSSLNENECGACMAGHSAVDDSSDEELSFPLAEDTACYRGAPTYSLEEVEFEWEPVAEQTGNTLLILEDDSNRVIDLPFKFPFHQELRSKVSVSSNGMLTFDTYDMSRSSAYSHSPRPVPDWRAPNDFVAALWDDLNPDVDGAEVRYVATSEKLVVEYNNVPYTSGNSAQTFTFQIELSKDGSILFNYKDVPEEGLDWTTVIGVEDQLGELGSSFDPSDLHSGMSLRLVPAPDLESLRSQLSVAKDWHEKGIQIFAKDDLNKLFLDIKQAEDKLHRGEIRSSRQLAKALRLFTHPPERLPNHDCEGFWTDPEDSICTALCVRISYWNETAQAAGNGTCDFINGEAGPTVPCVGDLCPEPLDVRVVAKHAWPGDDEEFPYPTENTAEREVSFWNNRLPQAVLDDTKEGRINCFELHLNGFIIYQETASSTRRRLLQSASIHQVHYYFDVYADNDDVNEATPLEIFGQLETMVDEINNDQENALSQFYPYIYEVVLLEIPPPAIASLTPPLNTEVQSGFQAFLIQFSGIVEFGDVASDEVIIRIRRFGAYEVATFTREDVTLQAGSGGTFSIASFYAPPNTIIQDANFETIYEVLIESDQAFVAPGTSIGLSLGFSWRFSIICPVSNCIPIVSDAYVDLLLADQGVLPNMTDTEIEDALDQELADVLNYDKDFMDVTIESRADGEIDILVVIRYDETDGRTPAEVAAQLAALFNDRTCPLCQLDILSQLRGIDWRLFPDIPRPTTTPAPTDTPEPGFPWWGILLIVLSILIVCGGVYFLYLQRQKTIERDGNLDPFTVEDDELEPTTADDDDEWGEPPIMSADSEPVVVDLGNI